jgi:16S rRNA (adenine1518-N6/adenine1519-N6)-dimethyltransferase
MFQKEVAQRICEKPGTKAYGILSVLCQLYYETEYHFNVSSSVFSPPPKVESGVLSLKRRENLVLDFDEKLLFRIVKTSFQQRRKTLRNSLKSLNIPKIILEDSIFDLRPEKLSGDEFIALTKKLENAKV